MIYKGSTPLKQFKSAGNCHIKSNDNSQTLETIPWYQEIRRYKGDNLIYPCFDVSNMSGTKPATAMDCFTALFSDKVRSSLNLYSADDLAYGITRQNGNISLGSRTRLASSNPTRFTLDCRAGWPEYTSLKQIINPYVKEESDGNDSYVEIPLMCISNQYQSSDPNDKSVYINEGKCLQYNYTKAIVDCSFFILTNSSLDSISCRLYHSVGEFSEHSLDYFSPCSSSELAAELCSFNYTKLWYVSLKSSAFTLNASNNYHYIKPFFSISTNDDFHFQVLNAKFCGFLYN